MWKASIIILSVGLYFNPQSKIDSSCIFIDNQGRFLSSNLAPKLLTIQTKDHSTPPSKYVRMTTMSGRLDHSISAIKSLVEPISGQAVVYDVGVGWPPVTTEELAETLGEQSQIIGIDHQLPAYIVITPEHSTVLLDENDRIINWMDDTIKTGDEIAEGNESRFMSLAKGLKQKALIREGGEYSDMDGNRIILNPIKKYQMKNVHFFKADLFHLREDTSHVSLPKAHIVRIANVLFRHYRIGDIERALTALHSTVLENGYVLIGRSSDFGPIAFDSEEYLGFKKKGDFFIFDSYLFSLRITSGLFIFGTGDLFNEINSPASRMTVSFHNILQDNPNFESWRTFLNKDLFTYKLELMEKLQVTSILKVSEQAEIEFNQKSKQLFVDVLETIARRLNQEGLKTEIHGSMLKVDFSYTDNLLGPIAKEFVEAIQSAFLDKGIPQKIEKPAENATDALQPLQRAL